MKRMFAAAVVLGLSAFVGPAVAGDPTGTWKSTSTLGNQTFESTLKLRLDSEGPRLTGAFMVGPAGEATPLANTQFKDGQISFSTHYEIKGERLTVKYSGKLRGDTITGKSQIERDGQVHTGDWTAQRQK